MVAMDDEATSSPERSEHEAEGTLHRLASLKAQPGSHHHFSDAEVRAARTATTAFVLHCVVPYCGRAWRESLSRNASFWEQWHAVKAERAADDILLREFQLLHPF